MRARWTLNRRKLSVAAVGVLVTATALTGVLTGTSGAVPVDGVTPVGDGYNHFVVQLSGNAVAPGSSAATNTDPVVLRAGAPAGDYLANLRALETTIPGADQGSVYLDAQGNLRLHVLSQTAALHQAQISAYRQAINTPAPATAVQRLASAPGIHSLVWILPGAVAVSTHLTRPQVARLPGVVSVAADPMASVVGTATPNNPFFPDQWGFRNTGQSVWNGSTYVSGTAGDDANVVPAWSQSTGTGVTVAVVDTGSQPDHPDLQGVYAPASGNVIGEAAGTFAPTTGQNDSGHGTFVSGIIAANTGSGQGVAGVAPGVKVLEVKASDSGSLYDSNVDAGINYALVHGAKIINLSLGGASYDPTMEAEIQQAEVDGVLVVVAAGNNGQNIDPTSANPAANTNTATMYPAAFSEPNIIAVGASGESDQRSSFSNFGASAVDLFAPGQDIYSTYPGSQYAVGNGTSFAAPMVAAAAALVWAKDPALTYDQVKADLMDTVHPVSALAGDCVTGGVLDTAAAVSAVSAVRSTAMTFRDFNAVTAGQPTSSSVRVTGTLPSTASGPLAWRLSLGVETSPGQAQAVQGEPITVDGTSTTTDAAGQVVVSPSGFTASSVAAGSSLSLSATYPWTGTYALVASLVPASDPTGPAFSTQAVFFAARAAPGGATGTSPGGSSGGSPATSSPAPTTSSPAPSSGTTPATSSPAPSSGTAPTTSSPAPSGGSAPPNVQVPPSTTTTPTTPTDPPTNTTPPPAPPSSGSGPQPPPAQPIVPSPSSGKPSSGGSPSSGTPTSGGSPSSGTPSPGGGPSAGTPTSGGSPSSGTPTSGGSPSAGTPPSGGGSTGTSPSSPSGPFGLMALSPASGPTSGGEPVTVYGTAIPTDAGVLIGGDATQLVALDAPASVQVLAPALNPGTYAVEVCAANGTCDTLPMAYTSVAATTSPAPGNSTAPGSNGGSSPTPPAGGSSTPPAGGSSTPPATTTPPTGGSSTPPTGGSGTPPTGGSGAGSPPTGTPALGRTSISAGTDLAATDPGMWNQELASSADQPGVVIW